MGCPLLIFTAVFAVWSVFIPIIKISRNYFKARKIGIRPILVTPVSLLGPIWATIGALIGVTMENFILALPLCLGSWINYSGHSWFYKQKYFLHEKYGPAFIIVTPSEVEVVIAEPETATEINRRNMDFIKMEQMYKPLDIFGPSVDTVNGETWRRHRRVTARPFNEKNNIVVWSEAINQASGMISAWTEISSNGKGVDTTTPDIMTLTLHVLQRAGFGKSFEFGAGGVTELRDGHTMTYKESLRILLSNLFTSIFIDGAGLLPCFMMPGWMNEIKTAVGEFRRYMIEMVEEERSKVGEEKHLLNVLTKLDEKIKPGGKSGLSCEEIYGNLFLYNVAGHDTVANTMVAAVFLMATNSHWQDWVREEILKVLEEHRGEWNYEKMFPKLNRCLAIMHETLRLFGPVPGTSRYTAEFPQQINIQGKKYTLPPRTFLPINHMALHSLPEYWGDDSLVWRPDRWITVVDGIEKPFQPLIGTFLPWTGGPRVCPGKKFSQVEFVATFAKLFHKNQVKPVLEVGETLEDAQNRVLATVQDCYVNMTLQIRYPDRVRLAWLEI